MQVSLFTSLALVHSMIAGAHALCEMYGNSFGRAEWIEVKDFCNRIESITHQMREKAIHDLQRTAPSTPRNAGQADTYPSAPREREAE